MKTKNVTDRKNGFEVNTENLQGGIKVMKALNHKLRLKILNVIHEKGMMVVSDIYKAIDLDQPSTSAHLGLLRAAKLVKTERMGQFRVYSVNYERVKWVEEKAGELANIEQGTRNIEYRRQA